MAGPLFVGAEGVILRPDKIHYGSSRPIMEGLELVTLLRKFPTSRLSVHFNTEDAETAGFYCKINGLPDVQVITLKPVDRNEEPWIAQWSAIQRQRATGPLNLVLTSYKRVFDLCTRSHQAVLLFGRVGAVGSIASEPTWDELQERVRRTREASVEGSSEPTD